MTPLPLLVPRLIPFAIHTLSLPFIVTSHSIGEIQLVLTGARGFAKGGMAFVRECYGILCKLTLGKSYGDEHL